VAKSQRLDLTKGNPGLKTSKVGLGWDVNEVGGVSFDLYAFCFGVGSSGKLSDMSHVCYFSQLAILSGAVKHSGDNLTGRNIDNCGFFRSNNLDGTSDRDLY